MNSEKDSKIYQKKICFKNKIYNFATYFFLQSIK